MTDDGAEARRTAIVQRLMQMPRLKHRREHAPMPPPGGTPHMQAFARLFGGMTNGAAAFAAWAAANPEENRQLWGEMIASVHRRMRTGDPEAVWLAMELLRTASHPLYPIVLYALGLDGDGGKVSRRARPAARLH